MSRRPPYVNHMSILWELKGVPYGGSGVLRPDGDANYGFKDLKGKPELLTTVPELVRDQSMMALVAAINKAHTGLFTVGCVSGEVADQQGVRYEGYVEFCINSASMIEDARSYFPLWFRFDEFLHQRGFQERVMFDWELQPASFRNASRTAAQFTCSIFINTQYAATKEEAWAVWHESLAVLTEYLGNIPDQGEDKLY